MKRVMVIATVAIAFVTGACGGEDGDEAGVAGAEESAALDPEEARLEWAQCMRENGANIPDPNAEGIVEVGPETELVTPDQMRRAAEACQEELQAMQESGALPPPPQGGIDERGLALAECMRNKGFDVPDPEMSDDGSSSVDTAPPELADDPDFQRAQEECQEEVTVPEVGSSETTP